MMRLLAFVVCVSTLFIGTVDSYSLWTPNNDSLSRQASLLSQKAQGGLQIPQSPSSLVTTSSPFRDNGRRFEMTHRDTIRMPSGTPMVPYKPPGSDVAQFVDIEGAMYRDRTMMISKYIDEEYANNIISIMLYLRKESPKASISMYFNVPGAQLRPALAVLDLMQNTRQYCEIQTVNLALCAGMGALLCAAGTPGKRGAMPNARFLLQRTGLDQPIRGQAIDIALEVKNMKGCNDRMEQEWSRLTGQPVERIQTDLRRDFYLSADEAVTYGVIDHVMLPSPRKRAARGGDEADLGAFGGGDEQRYQNRNGNTGGWGSRSPPPNGDRPNGGEDDDEPKIMKG